jgi:hypothetical protein
MAKTNTIKRSKVFASEIVKGEALDTRLNSLAEANANIIAVIPVNGDMDVYRVVSFSIKEEIVEIEIPDELAEALDQADGAAQA